MKTLRILIASITILTLSLSLARADEIGDQIEKGKSLYAQQKFSQAVNELRFAVGQIMGKIAELYIQALPQAVSGWEANEPETQSAGMEFLGGGISVKRHFYKNEGASVDVGFVSDSPMLSSLMMMIGNPMFLGGNKLVTIKGEKCVEEWNESEKSGKLDIVIENRIMVTIEGSGLANKDDLYSYANAVDLAKLKGILRDN